MPVPKGHGFAGPMRVRGFTLLEIMLVLAIMALASLLVFPGLTGLESRTFGAQVREAHTLLNYARRIAVVSGQPSTATFHVTGTDDESSSALPSARSSVGGWQGEGITLRYRDSTDRESEVEESLEITFFPEGGSTGGTLLLAAGDRTAALYIDPITGRVEIEALDE